VLLLFVHLNGSAQQKSLKMESILCWTCVFEIKLVSCTKPLISFRRQQFLEGHQGSSPRGRWTKRWLHCFANFNPARTVELIYTRGRRKVWHRFTLYCTFTLPLTPTGVASLTPHIRQRVRTTRRKIYGASLLHKYTQPRIHLSPCFSFSSLSQPNFPKILLDYFYK
jgi:hypothetical protein